MQAFIKIFLILLFLAKISLGAQVEIYLKEIVYLSKYEVNLSDIADIKAKNQNLKKYLSSIIVKKIYDKGVITKEDILKSLKENFIDLSQAVIHGEKTIVAIKKTTIDRVFLEKHIRNYIRKSYPNVEIENISIRNVSISVIGKPEIIVKEKGKTSSYIYLSVIFPDLNKEISASVRYTQIIKAVVANYPLPKGHIIKPKDVKISYIKPKRIRGYIDKIDLVLGKKLKRSIKKDEPIGFRDLEKEYLVRKNNNVKVVYKKGSFKIELLGRALENGEKEQIIRVKNISSGKVIQCKVIGINKVEFLSGDY
ncbi:MAG: flagella basal body P-ring formation protein FlgA [Hydrogenothermus sp.]|nr:MAG: flagella basal body P-ring formation protein FlgA [Hydrogenothermus sp.]